MVAFNGIKVEAYIDDTAIPEYLVWRDLAQKRVTCGVPSQTGKNITISVTNESQDKLSVKVKADGTIIQEHILSPLQTKNVVFDLEPSTVVPPFISADIDLRGVDEDDPLTSGCPVGGTVELLCHSFRPKKTPEHLDREWNCPENNEVQKRAKKGVVQHVDIATVFILRGIPFGYPQAQGIAPMDVPEQITSSIDTLTSDERSSKQEGSAPGGHEPGAKVDDTVKEEYISENEDDDDIKALLVIAEQMKAKIEGMRARKRKKKMAEAPRKKVKKEESPPAFP